MKRNRLHLPLLAGSLVALLAGVAGAATTAGERPRASDYSNYGDYVTALVDYERKQTEAAARRNAGRSDKSKVCADTQDGNRKQQNSCQGKYLTGEAVLENVTEREAEPQDDFFLRGNRPQNPESLDEAVARAGVDSLATVTLASLNNPNGGMTLQEISPDEMASAGVEGLLGLVNNVRMQSLSRSSAPLGAWGLAAGGSGTSVGGVGIGEDGALRFSVEDLRLLLEELNVNFLGSIINFGDGYGVVSADVSLNPNGGLHLDLTSEIYTSLSVVDRDGLPGSAWAGAGALTLDHMAVLIPYMSVDIQGVNADFGRDNSLLRIDAYSPGEITVDFAGTSIGVAAATRDGSWIGPSKTFLQFGPDSRLTVANGTRVRVDLGAPDGMKSAFVTLNGNIGDISLGDIRLLDNQGGGQLRIGRFAISGLDLVDTRIFVEDNRVTVDLGRGMSNVGIDMERIWLGNETEGNFVGDFYARGARLTDLRLVAQPH